MQYRNRAWRWHEYRQIYNYSSFNAIGCFFFFSYFNLHFGRLYIEKVFFQKTRRIIVMFTRVGGCHCYFLGRNSMIICMTFLFEGNTSRSIDLKGYDKRSKGFSVKHREYKMQIQAVNFNSRIILHPLPLLRFTSRRGRSCNWIIIPLRDTAEKFLKFRPNIPSISPNNRNMCNSPFYFSTNLFFYK